MAENSSAEALQMFQNKEQQFGLPQGTLDKIWSIESGRGKNMLSPVGAKGHFQFMEPTGKQYGLVAPEDYSDLDKSSTAAASFMADNLKRYNGNMDMALAYYNGGGKAVKALAKGKPWKETADYLAKFNGGNGSPLSNPTDGVLKGFASDSVTYAPTASQLESARGKHRAEHGGVLNNLGDIPDAVALSFEENNTVVNFWKDQAIKQIDPDFKWTEDFAKEVLDGIAPQYHEYIMQAQSVPEATARRGRMLESMKNSQELSQMGLGATLAGGLVGGLVDLPTLLMVVPGAQGEGLLTAGGRLANAFRMGMVGAGTNVAVDALTMNSRPMATTDDLWISGLMGLGMGAVAGASVNPSRLRAGLLAKENEALAQFGRKEASRLTYEEINARFGGNGEYHKNFISSWGEQQPRQVKESGIHIITDTPEGTPKSIGRGIPDEPIKTPPEASAFVNGSEPRFTESNGYSKRLELPEGLSKIDQLTDYIRKHSVNDDLKLVMERVLKVLDIDKIDFQILSKGKRWQGLPKHVDGGDFAKSKALGSLYTPIGSEGDGLMMALGDKTIRADGKNGLNEVTFIHELVHGATVYKQRIIDKALGSGLEATDPAIREAAKGVVSLRKQLVTAAKAEFGVKWSEGLNGRLGTHLKNDKELLAYGMTDRNFQEWLKSVPVKGKAKTTLWDTFVDALASMLGISKGETNALARLIELSAPLTTEGGIVRKSGRKFAAMDNAPVDSQLIDAAEKAELNTVFGWGVALENRLMNSKVVQSARDLAATLIGTTIGFKNHAVVPTSVWDTRTQLSQSLALKFRKGSYPAFEEWFLQSGMKPREKSEAFYKFGEEISNYIRGFENEYSPQAIKAGNSIRKVLSEAREHINNPMKGDGGVKLGLTETEVIDEAGLRKVIGTLEENPFYLPRKHDPMKWNSMIAAHGREATERWWAKAYQSGRGGITDEAANKWSSWYLRTVEEAHANRSHELLDDLMRGQDKDALKQSLIRNGGYTDSEAFRIMEDMFPSKDNDSGRAMASLKHRNTINERYSEVWKVQENGQWVDKNITLNDFIHSNVFDVVEPYLDRVAGNVALAKHLDIYKVGDINAAIEAATRNSFDGKISGSEVTQMRKDFQFIFDRIQGLPQEEFTSLNKSLQMWRDFNVIRLMGGTVWNQMTEMSQIIGTMGWRNTLEAVGELKALRRDIASGKAPHDILEHLENAIGGVGSEYVARLEFKASDDWVRHKGDTAFNRKLDSLDNGFKKMAKGVLDYTGMTPLMIQQKRVHAVALVNHFVNLANEVKVTNPNFLSTERLAWMGMSPDDFKSVKADIKAYTKPKDGDYSKSFKMDFAEFQKNSPENYSKLMTAIHRESRRVIQENDLASMIPLMGSTLGKTVFQFMNFSLQGWNKSLMYGMNHRDWSTLSTVMHGGLFASLAYMGRTQLDALGMSEENRTEFLDRRMSTKQIVANSFGRTAQVSILPNLYDATLGHVTGAMFSGMRTTSDLSGLASNPTLSGMNAVLSLGKTIKNAVSDEEQTTRGDIRKWGKLLPLNNVVPVSTFMNAISNDFPRNKTEQ